LRGSRCAARPSSPGRRKPSANTWSTVKAIGEEAKRVAAPGSSWNDGDRAQWEAELDDAALEIAMRADRATDPTAAATRALNARALERGAKTQFEAQLEAEFEEMGRHDQTAEHRQVLAKADVEDFARTHEPDGSPRR
jgi:hypothetical protein